MSNPARPLPNSARRGQSRQRGQALVEFALVMPLFLVLVVGSAAGQEYLSSTIDIAGAANAAAIVASNDVASYPGVGSAQLTADVTNAVNAEEGCSACFVGVADQASCPARANCVWMTQATGSGNQDASIRIDVVHVLKHVAPLIPLASNLTVITQAAANP